MIDFHSYEEVKLEDVAEFGRAKKGHIYPKGSSILQISATRGQLGYLEQPSEVATKDVVIIPQLGINPKYFNIILEFNIDRFMNKYATGINIQEAEVGKFPVMVHDRETQRAVVAICNQFDMEEQQIRDDVAALTEMKGYLIGNMFV